MNIITVGHPLILLSEFDLFSSDYPHNDFFAAFVAHAFSPYLKVALQKLTVIIILQNAPVHVYSINAYRHLILIFSYRTFQIQPRQARAALI
jgi:hypothetical protein